MKVYRYWAQAAADASVDGQTWPVRCYGGSDIGLAEAERAASDRARRVAGALGTGAPPNAYLYGDRPVREEIVNEMAGPDGPAAIVTRNVYGALILNTARAFFADIDLPPAPRVRPSAAGILGRLLGRKTPDAGVANDPLVEIPARVVRVAAEYGGLGGRLYRTRAGFRCLVTSRGFDPMEPETEVLLRALGSDPLYVRLCRVQECFRARLTAKCWRVGVSAPPGRYPFADGAAEAIQRRWEERYHEVADGFAACALETSFGDQSVHLELADVVALHDRLACADGAPLA